MALQIFGGGSGGGGGGGGGTGGVLALDTDGVPYFTGGDTTAPTVPGTPVATGGNASASVAFTSSTDAVGVVGYRVYKSTDSYASIAATGASSPISVTGLTNGTALTFKVSAYDAAGNESALTAASNSVTPAVVPVTVVSDNFNRADAGTLGAPQIGTIVAENTAWIRSNQGQMASSTSYAVWAATSNDHTIQFTWGVGAATIWRWTDVSNYYFWAGQYVQKRVAGASTVLVDLTALGKSSGIPAAGDVVKVTTSGSTHSLYKNGTLVHTFTDAAIPTGANAGVYTLGGNTGTFDNLTITTP